MRHIASHFNSYFINVDSEALDSTATLNKLPFASYLGPRCHLAFSFSYTNSEKILTIIEKLKPKTSSGPDGQSSKLLKAVGNILARTLSVIMNQSLYTGIFPDKIKVAKVLPLLKNGDNWLMEIIAPFLYYQHCLAMLLTEAWQVFERVVFEQIYEYLNSNNLLHQSHYGFRKDHSTGINRIDRPHM